MLNKKCDLESHKQFVIIFIWMKQLVLLYLIGDVDGVAILLEGGRFATSLLENAVHKVIGVTNDLHPTPFAFRARDNYTRIENKCC